MGRMKNSLLALRDRMRLQPDFGKIGWLLATLFPIFFVLIVELNQMQSISSLWGFITSHTGIFVFDVLYVTLAFLVILLLSRRTFLSAVLLGVPLYALSCVEYLKYSASNSHFQISDLLLTFSVKDIAGLATINITPALIFCGLSLICYLLAMWVFACRITRLRHRVCSAVALVLACANTMVIVSPNVATAVYDAAGFENEPVSCSNFSMNEEFQTNNFIASLVKNTQTELQRNIVEPRGYSETNIVTLPQAAERADSGLHPNVLVIMSESFADMRRLKLINENAPDISDDIYTNFDALRAEGYGGVCAVPTFGGYTTRTEFELTMGLPVNSLNNLAVPQFKLDKNRQQISLASAFHDDGYATCYMHPYYGSFYGRDEILPTFGYDDTLFLDDMDPENIGAENYRRYMDDGAVFEKAVNYLANTDRPVYLHLTTMQNHQPYQDEEGDDQLDYYLTGIQHTDEALGQLAQSLRQLNEPTIVLFVGDHYPFFTGDDSVYNQLGVDSSNSELLYLQPYLMWSNYPVSFAKIIGGRTLSAFYLPYELRQAAGLSQSTVEAILDEKQQSLPLYTEPYLEVPRDATMDRLVYDITIGKQYIRKKDQDNNDE